MTIKGYLIFVLVFVAAYDLVETLLFHKELTVGLVLTSLTAGLLTALLFFGYEKLENPGEVRSRIGSQSTKVKDVELRNVLVKFRVVKLN